MNARLNEMWRILNQRIDSIEKRTAALEAEEKSPSVDQITQLTFADAGALSPTGVAFRYITDGLREGGGTGTLAWFDGSTWRRVSDNAVVTT